MPPVPQTTKKVSDVCLKTKSCDPSCFDVWATWDAGLHQHSGRGERKRNRTHTDLVPRTNNLSDKPAGIPRKSPNKQQKSHHIQTYPKASYSHHLKITESKTDPMLKITKVLKRHLLKYFYFFTLHHNNSGANSILASPLLSFESYSYFKT